jgi:hypothetical protein
MPDYALNDPAVLAFVIIPVLLVAALAYGVWSGSRRLGEPPAVRHRAVIVTIVAAAAWMGSTWAAAQSGALLDFNRTPPPFALLVIAVFILAARIALTRYGWRLAFGVPLWALVALQSFRLPLELAMHGLYERGIMPVQMTYTGRNFDIVTGATAIVVAALAWSGKGGRLLVAAWNLLGLALLINVIVVAILSTPRFRAFGDDRVNVFVMYTPFVWLPAVMVLAALAGHLLVFRALRQPGPQR